MTTATLLGLSLSLNPAALTALRIAPLLSSTASLTHAYMEWLTNSAFLKPAPVESRLNLFLLGHDAPTTNTDTPATLRVGDDEGMIRSTNSDEEMEKAKQIVVPEWFTNFFNTGVVSVITFNTLTLFSATLNLGCPHGLGGSKVFYKLGLAAALAHYAFVPLVGGSVRALIGLAAFQARGAEVASKKEEGGKAVDWVREWVGYHAIRMCSVDVLAWGCFVWGGVHALTAHT